MFGLGVTSIGYTEKSVYKNVRTAAVLGGGAVGGALGGGLVGSAVGGIAGGAVVDVAATVITDEPHGYVKGIVDIADDISNRRVPLGSGLRTGLLLGSDAMSGIAAGSFVASCSNIPFGELASLSVVKEADMIRNCVIVAGTAINVAVAATPVVAATVFSDIVIDMMHEESPKNQSSHQNSSSSNGGNPKPSSSQSSASSSGGKTGTSSNKRPSSTSGDSGGKPPNNNPNNNENNKKEHYEEKVESYFDEFQRILQENSIETIMVKGRTIFKGLNRGQKNELKRVLAEIRSSEFFDLQTLVYITLDVMSMLDDDDVTFINFVSVTKFIKAYVHEQIVQRNDAYHQSPSDFPNLSSTFRVRQIQLAEIITSETAYSSRELRNLLQGLMNKIKNLMPTIDPQFVNVLAAVYHYFKHKSIPETGEELTPDAYFELVKKELKRMQSLPEYKELIDRGVERIVYERYDAKIGRRLQTVVKKQAGKLNVSSCYYIDEIYEGDTDGDEWINGVKLPRRK